VNGDACIASGGSAGACPNCYLADSGYNGCRSTGCKGNPGAYGIGGNGISLTTPYIGYGYGGGIILYISNVLKILNLIIRRGRWLLRRRWW